jgi:hypothetical protein
MRSIATASQPADNTLLNGYPMRPLKPPDGKCPQGGERTSCNLACKYNYFEAGELMINSWELKCLDCGYRQTVAWRTDEDGELPENPGKCPFCNLCNLSPGRNPCQM